MKKIDIAGLAYKNFTRRKARSVLTILGVVIGTMAVVIMLSIGEGLRLGMEAQVNSWGSITEIEVMPNYSPDGKQTVLNKESLEQLKSLQNVTAVMPIKRYSGIVLMGKKNTYVDILAVDTKEMAKFETNLFDGKMVDGTNDLDVTMGYLIPFNFIDPKNPYEYNPPTDEEGKFNPLPFNPMEEKIELTFDTSVTATGPREPGKKPKKYELSVVGVTAAAFDNNSYSIFMDYEVVSKLYADYEKSQNNNGGNNGDGGNGVYGNGGMNMGGSSSDDKNKSIYDSFKLKVDHRDNVQSVLTSITDLGFYGQSNMDYLIRMQQQASLIQMILGGVGAIAFIVSALGITNTMMMSTYERTREIGIMKVMGCKLADIRDLFLTEACIIGFLGGVVGIVFSEIVSIVLNSVGGIAQALGFYISEGVEVQISIIPIWLIVIGIIFTTLIGLLSGFYPAMRAIKLSALEAIKNE